MSCLCLLLGVTNLDHVPGWVLLGFMRMFVPNMDAEDRR
jgi:hypothetical protein